MTKSEGPYKAYYLMTNELIGGYENEALAYVLNKDKAITVIYRPGRKKKVKK
jgi:hypothetical protein